ncbi:MAG: hypothetical protein NTX48_15415 [Planctomycetales bacterium]|nr:hypothetical protein [Planctomycetales bacterium]
MLTMLIHRTTWCDGFSRRDAVRLSLRRFLDDQTGQSLPLNHGQVLRETLG